MIRSMALSFLQRTAQSKTLQVLRQAEKEREELVGDLATNRLATTQKRSEQTVCCLFSRCC